MPFHPRDFLSFARSLAGGNSSEEGLRTAVGRAYYGLFLIARERTRLTVRNRVHAEVKREVRRRDKATGDKLGALHRLRLVADYEVVPVDPGDRDWGSNWSRADAIASEIAPRIENI